MEDFKGNKNDSYCWKRPKAVADDISNTLFQQGKTIIPRLLGFIFLLEYVLYTYLKIVLPDEVIPDEKLWLPFFTCFLFAIGFCLWGYLLTPLMVRWQRGSYTINSKKVSFSSFEKQSRIIQWKRIKGYWIKETNLYPDLVSVIFKMKNSQLLNMWLPEDKKQHPEILAFIDNHATLIEPCQQESPFTFTKGQLQFCWSFTIIFSIIAAMVFEIFSLQKHAVVFFAILLIPGVISMALALWKKFYKDKSFSYAFILNMAAFMLFMTIVILVELYKYHKIIEGN